MADNDLILLEEAKDAAFALDKAYRRAVRDGDMDAAMELRPKVNQVHSALSSARMNLLGEGVLATDGDVAEMRRIKSDIDHAVDGQQMITATLRIVGLFARFA